MKVYGILIFNFFYYLFISIIVALFTMWYNTLLLMSSLILEALLKSVFSVAFRSFDSSVFTLLFFCKKLSFHDLFIFRNWKKLNMYTFIVQLIILLIWDIMLQFTLYSFIIIICYCHQQCSNCSEHHPQIDNKMVA